VRLVICACPLGLDQNTQQKREKGIKGEKTPKSRVNDTIRGDTQEEQSSKGQA